MLLDNLIAGSPSFGALMCALWVVGWAIIGRVASNQIAAIVSLGLAFVEIPGRPAISAIGLSFASYVLMSRPSEFPAVKAIIGGLIGWHLLAMEPVVVSASPLIRSEIDVSVFVAALSGWAVTVSAILRSDRFRTYSLVASGVAISLLTWATLGATLSVALAYRPIERARLDVERVRAGLSQGSIEGLGPAIDDLVIHLDRARAMLSSPLSAPGRIVPIVAQHHAVPLELVSSLTEVARTLADLLDRFTAATGTSGSAFDSGDIDSVADEVERLTAKFEALDAAAIKLDHPWLLPALRSQLVGLRYQLGGVLEALNRAADFAGIADELFGGSERRRYFVAFVTPAEARPGGGFLGNYAVVTADDGDVSLSEFGRTLDLNIANEDPASRVLKGVGEYATRYAPFGSGGGTEPAAAQWWSVVTLSPDIPSVSLTIATLFEQAGNEPIDGVIVIDPAGLAALMEASGPVTLPSLGRTFDSSNVTDFLLREQYLVYSKDQIHRVQFLEELSRRTMTQLVESPANNAWRIASAFRDAADQGHAAFWSRHAVEQSVFHRLAIDGDFSRPKTGDALALTQLNAGGNKLDAFVRREIAYHAQVDQATGAIVASVTVTLHNDVVVDGLPESVIGNSRGDPLGVNRLFLTMYSPHTLVGFTVDGVAVDVTTGTELGWQFAEREVAVPVGGNVVLRYDLSGQLEGAAPYRLSMPSRALGQPDSLSVNVVSATGRSLVDYRGESSASMGWLENLGQEG